MYERLASLVYYAPKANWHKDATMKSMKEYCEKFPRFGLSCVYADVNDATGPAKNLRMKFSVHSDNQPQLWYLYEEFGKISDNTAMLYNGTDASNLNVE